MAWRLTKVHYLTHWLISTQVCRRRTLATSLTITNSENKEIAPQCLLHTYLNVADSKQVMIFGLEESEYADKLTGKTEQEDMPAIASGARRTVFNTAAHHEKRARSPCGPRA